MSEQTIGLFRKLGVPVPGGRPSVPPSTPSPPPTPAPSPPKRVYKSVMGKKLGILERKGFMPPGITEKIEKVAEEKTKWEDVRTGPRFKTFTGREWLQTTTERMMEREQQWKEMERVRGEIDPGVTYSYVHPMTGEKTHLLGEHIVSMYIDPAVEQAKSGFLQSQQVYRHAQFLPPSVKVKETPKGYEIHRDIVAESRVDWEKLSPAQQVGKSAYVGLTQWPGTLIEAFTSPITGKPVKEYSKELITWEASTWEQAKGIHRGESPWPFIGSTLTTPAVVEAVTLGIFKGASILVRPVARAGIRTGARITHRIVSVIPDEKIYSHFVGKLVESPLGKKIWEWSSKGYKFGYRLAPGGTTPIRETIGMGKYLRGEKITQKLISGGRLERVWLSPSAQKFAQQDIAKHLGRRISIGFPKPGGEMSVVQKTTKFGGVFGKKLITYQKTFYTGYRPFPKIAGATVYRAPGFIRGGTTPGIALKGLPVESGKSQWFRTVGEWRSIQAWKPGTPISPVRTVLLSPEKRWHLVALGKKRLPLSFRRAKEAVASLRPQFDISLYRPSKTIGVSAIQRLEAPVIIGGIPLGEIATIYGISKLGKFISKPRQDRFKLPTIETRRDLVFAPMRVSALAKAPAIKPVTSTVPKLGFDITNILTSRFDMGPLYMPKTEQKFDTRGLLPILGTPVSRYQPTGVIPVVIPWGGTFGRRRQAVYPDPFADLEYKIRVFKLPKFKLPNIFG